MSTTISTKNLSYRPGKGFEIADLSIGVPSGSVYGFLGPNGSGKTTTIKLLLGLLKPRSGAIEVLDQAVPRHAWKALQGIGYVPEAPHVYTSFSMQSALAYHSAFYPTFDHGMADDMRRRFNIGLDRRLASLSKGELRKFMLLLSMCHRPRLLVLDEPTDGLDPVVRRDMLDVIQETVDDPNTTVFLSSHLVHELETVCNWIAVMDKGRLVAEMPMEEFRNGIKRLRVANMTQEISGLPFDILRRDPAGDGRETWIVRGWQPNMTSLPGAASIEQIHDVSLEDGFVELLRSFRVTGTKDE